MLAPVVLFVYNRPEHTRKTLESLERNILSKESELFVFADGPKENATEEQLKKISETRKIIRENNWCGKVNIVERENNMGLANSVIAGVTEIVDKFGKAIILEDDLLLSKNFLKYMNSALDRFENEENVMQVSGYMFPVEISAETDAFFLPFTTSWGWGTWKSAWDFFDKSASGIEMLENDRKLKNKFNLNGAQNYYRMLRNQQAGKIDSWAIRFYLSVFLKNGLVLFPRRTMVNNAGFDGSGVHCKLEIKQRDISDDFIVSRFSDLKVDHEAQSEIEKFLRRQNNFPMRIFNTFVKKIRR